jgi:hypothetical protein
MEIDITDFFNAGGHMAYSASIAEVGPDAGRSTWRNACDDSEEYCLLDTPEKLEAAREYFRGFGAWSADELAAMPDREVNALLLQFIAGDIREFSEDVTAWDWTVYNDDAAAGRIGGNLFEGDDNRVYIYIGG